MLPAKTELSIVPEISEILFLLTLLQSHWTCAHKQALSMCKAAIFKC